MFENTNQPEEEGITVSSRLARIMIAGFALIFIGVIILVLALVQNGSGSVGGVVFIGPIPIVFGAGPDANWLIIIGIIIALVMIVGFFVFTKRSKRILS
jgi:LPXTG-motif cell wall-anchored protein